MEEFVRVCELSELEPGVILGAHVKGRTILLVNIGGEVHALSGTCTHESTDLSAGFLLSEEITCPLHLSRFSVKTGEAINPPATEPLKKFTVRVEGTLVYVSV